MDLLAKTATSSYFDPALAAKLKKEREAAHAAAEAARIAEEHMMASYELVHAHEIPHFDKLSLEQINGLPGPVVAFINPSDVLGEIKPVVSFDGSPSVFVPLPQHLFQTSSYASRAATHAVAPVQAAAPAVAHAPHPHGSASDLEQLISQQDPLANASSSNERGQRGGRGGSRRGGGNPRPNTDNRTYDKSQDNANYHKSYERNHDKEYSQQQPRRGGSSSGAGRGGRGGSSRGGHAEASAN